MRACPTAGLQPAVTQADWEGVMTPVLIPQLGWCEQNCNACGEVCPTGALTIEEREAPEFSEEAVMEHTRKGAPAPSDVCCSLCGAADAERPLLACRWKGESVWVCVRCLPQLIHG